MLSGGGSTCRSLTTLLQQTVIASLQLWFYLHASTRHLLYLGALFHRAHIKLIRTMISLSINLPELLCGIELFHVILFGVYQWPFLSDYDCCFLCVHSFISARIWIYMLLGRYFYDFFLPSTKKKILYRLSSSELHVFPKPHA